MRYLFIVLLLFSCNDDLDKRVVDSYKQQLKRARHWELRAGEYYYQSSMWKFKADSLDSVLNWNILLVETLSENDSIIIKNIIYRK